MGKFSFGTLLLTLFFLAGCGSDDINDSSKRNDHWGWWVDSTGKGKWIPLSNHPTWKNGHYVKFYFDGKIGEKGTIKNGKHIDTTFFIDRNGIVNGYKLYVRDSSDTYYVRNGPIKIYSLNGKILMEGNIEDHKIGGKQTDYYPNGRVERTLDLVNDTGWAVHFYETGQIKDSQFWINDNAFEVGSWNEEGTLIRSGGWKNLHFDGESLRYYENGNLWTSANYSNGKVNGKMTVYYLSGEVECIYQYKDSLKDGQQIEYYKNGQIQSDLLFKEGKADGVQKKYDEKGNLIVTAIFDKGVRIK